MMSKICIAIGVKGDDDDDKKSNIMPWAKLSLQLIWKRKANDEDGMEG